MARLGGERVVAMFEFDTGRPDAWLTEVAQGYVHALERMRWVEGAEPTSRGPYLRQLDISHFQPSLKDIESRWLNDTPAAIVHVTGARPESHHHGSIDWQVSVDIHLFSGHAGGEAEGRIVVDQTAGRTTLHDPGMHVLVHHVTEYLHGARPTEYCLSSIFPSDIRRIGDGAQWAWWIYETEVKCRQAINPERDVPPVERVELAQGTPNDDDTIVEHRRVY